MKPPGVMLKQLAYFVGREDTLKEIQQCLKDVGFLYLDVVEGVEGMGKTTLLIKLYEDLKKHPEFNPIWVCMTVFDPFRKGAVDNPDALVNLANDLDDYRQLLLELASEFPVENFSDFGEYVQKFFASSLSELLTKEMKVDLGGVNIQTGDIHVGAFSRLADGQFKTGDVVVKVPDQQFKLAIDHLKNALTGEFVKRVNQVEKKLRCVLLLDNFQLVLDDQVGNWFLTGVATQLDNTVVVLAKTKTQAALDLPDSQMIGLPNFSDKEVELYLSKRLDLKNFPPSLPKLIYDYTGGHPQAVVLAADVCESLQKKGMKGQVLTEIFGEIPLEQAQKLTKLVDKIKDSIQDEAVKKALDIGWVVRRFDAELMRYLLLNGETPNNPDGSLKYGNIISRLEEYSFTEDHEEYYKFHDFIRRAMEQRLKKDDPQRYQEIHAQTARYYGEKLIAYDRDRKDQSSYLQWYRYEAYEWQAMMAEWLFHLKHAPQRQFARMMFLQVYVDAFWWWGFYERFPFCERLLSEWGKAQMDDDDRNWLRLIHNFHEFFPTGYQKRGKGNWPKVQTALCCLRQLGGLEEKHTKLDGNQRHLKGLTNIFLSNAHFYQDVQDPQAETLLLEAMEIFKTDEDEWNVMWTFFHLANVYIECQKILQARDFIAKALVTALEASPEKRDYEILANIHRIYADIYDLEQKGKASLRSHARSVASAYLYHGLPSPADLYTLSFHREMIERTLTRLKMGWDAGKFSEVEQGCQELFNFFLPYRKAAGQSPAPKTWGDFFKTNQLDALSEILFPRLPTETELNQSGNAYTDQAKMLMNAFTAELEKVD